MLRKILYGLIGAAAVLIVMSVVTLATRASRPKVRPVPTTYRVSLLSSRLGAEIKLDGKVCGRSLCELTLGPGTYRAEAQLAGFVPAVTIFSVSAEKPVPPSIELMLVAAPPLITISSDLPDGSVLVDGAPVGQVQDGGAEIPTLLPGNHEISVQSGELRAAFILEVADGAVPKISAPIQVRGLRAFVIVESGAEATWYGSETDIKIALDGHPLGDLVKEGIQMKDLTSGTHELIFTGPAAQQDKLVFEAKSSTAIYLRISRKK
jgi:hypothetical protein